MRSSQRGVRVQSKEGVKILCKHRMAAGIFEAIIQVQTEQKAERQKNGQKCATKDKNRF